MEWRWVGGVMEVGCSFGLCDLLCTRYLGLGREEMRVQRGDKDSKKLIRWAPKCVQFYYRSATGNTCLLFKINSEHIPKNVVRTWVLEQ